MRNLLLILTIVVLSACSNKQPSTSTELMTVLSPDQIEVKRPLAVELVSVDGLNKDLTQIESLLDSVHPSPSFTMDVAEVKFQINELKKEIKTPMTRREAWKLLSQLNPYFQDGHMVISYPDFIQQQHQHIDNGGRMFPVEVQIDKSHHIYVTDTKGINKGVEVGDKITAINGVDASEIIKSMLTRMHGDTVSNRLALLSDRFANMYWLLYGDTGHYKIDFKRNNVHGQYSAIGNRKKLGDISSNLTSFVERKLLANNIGYLRIDRFYYAPEHEKGYFDFMEESWLAFKKANVQDVIIDVRNNPGGTDHYWQQGIAPYVANKPFPFLSHFKIRLTEGNLARGPIKGELNSLVEGPFNQLVPIKPENDLRIPGKAYLLMGPLSYSSTILFLTAFQDSNQAIIAGQSSGARSCTTGRIETKILSESNLEITLPTLIFTRPSGNESCHQPIKPDIFIPDNRADPILAVKKLAKEITRNR